PRQVLHALPRLRVDTSAAGALGRAPLLTVWKKLGTFLIVVLRFVVFRATPLTQAGGIYAKAWQGVEHLPRTLAELTALFSHNDLSIGSKIFMVYVCGIVFLETI